MRSHQPLPQEFTLEPFTYGQARAAGVGAGRLRASDIQAPFRGVRHPSPNSLALHDRCAAFQVGMPRRAFFNSVTAARLMSLPLPLRLERDSRLHVATPSPGRGLAARGIVGHKVQTQSDELRVWNGLRISGPERTFCELTSILSLSELVAVGDFLIHWRTPICSMDDLFAAVESYPGRRGAARLREAVGLLDARSESPQESELRVLIVLAGFTGFEVNYPIVVERRRYRGDLVFPRQRVVVEYLGDYHRDPAQWRRDVSRASRLREAGWFVLEVTIDDLRDAADFLNRLRRVLVERS